MKKILLLFAVAMIMTFSILNIIVTPAEALSVKIDGNAVPMDVEPFIDANGRTMVPVRFVSEALTAMVDWDTSTRTVTVTKGATIIKLVVDSRIITVNGSTITMDTAAVIRYERTFVPVRYIAEALGLNVGWDESTKAVVLSTIGSKTTPAPGLEEGAKPKVGDTIQFGGYDWIILDVQEGKGLIISKDIIALLPFDDSFIDGGSNYRPIAWKDCSLRNWLNDYFYFSFGDGLREVIVPCNLQSEEVMDNIFILSVDELEHYAIANPALFRATLRIPENEYLNFRSSAFVYATDQGDDDEFYAWTTSLSDSFGWWLRTQGEKGIAYVGPWAICYDGEGGHDDDCWGVRPAMWVELSY